MPVSQDKDPRADAKDLLLADYHNFAESLWKNEQTGETRVNWFIGIFTAVGAGLIGLTSAEHRPHGEPLRLIYVASLLAMLCFGVVTLFRIFKRNATTDGYKNDSDRIRKLFRKHFDDSGVLRKYHPFRAGDGDDNKDVRKLGGLAHTVAAINSLLIAGIAAAFAYPFGWTGALAPRRHDRIVLTYVVGGITFIISAIAQYFWIRWTEKKIKAGLLRTSHVGGIVFKGQGNEVKYLLVGPSREKKREEWLFPKGHIEDDEEQWQTALREVKEETGVIARPVCPVGSDSFKVKRKKVRVKFYLLETIAEGTAEEERRKDWFSLEDALKKLTFPKSIRLLYKAERKRRNLENKI